MVPPEVTKSQLHRERNSRKRWRAGNGWKTLGNVSLGRIRPGLSNTWGISYRSDEKESVRGARECVPNEGRHILTALPSPPLPPRTEIGLNRWNYRRRILHTPRRGNAFLRFLLCHATLEFSSFSFKEGNGSSIVDSSKRETDRCQRCYPVTSSRLSSFLSMHATRKAWKSCN